jgi:hypothetical protein
MYSLYEYRNSIYNLEICHIYICPRFKLLIIPYKVQFHDDYKYFNQNWSITYLNQIFTCICEIYITKLFKMSSQRFKLPVIPYRVVS